MKFALLICFICSILCLPACGNGNSTGATNTAAGNESSKPIESHALPKVPIPAGPPPKKLVVKDLKVGTGPETKNGEKATVQYVGFAYKTGKKFDARPWSEPFTFSLGTGGVQPGWERGLVGMKTGGQRELLIPPDLTLNELGRPETLIYVIELLGVKK